MKISGALDDIFAAIDNATLVVDVLDLLRDHALAAGAKTISYHLAPTLFSQTSEPVIVAAYGFDEKWLVLYNDPDFRENDPIPDVVMNNGVPTLWEDALSMKKLTRKEQHYADMMKKFGLERGLGIPLFGPHGRDAYSSVSFHDDSLCDGNSLISVLTAVWQAGHVRVVKLLEDKRDVIIELSTREKEVLRLLAKGQSKTEMAHVLEVSSSTIDTYLRRLYTKLDVNDRVGATVRAISLGILKL